MFFRIIFASNKKLLNSSVKINRSLNNDNYSVKLFKRN